MQASDHYSILFSATWELSGKRCGPDAKKRLNDNLETVEGDFSIVFSAGPIKLVEYPKNASFGWTQITSDGPPRIFP